MLDGDLKLTGPRVLFADRLRDHRRVRRQRARMVGDEEGTPVVRHVLDALDLGAKPALVEELEQGRVESGLDPFGATPVVEAAFGLDGRQELTRALDGGGGGEGGGRGPPGGGTPPI